MSWHPDLVEARGGKPFEVPEAKKKPLTDTAIKVNPVHAVKKELSVNIATVKTYKANIGRIDLDILLREVLGLPREAPIEWLFEESSGKFLGIGVDYTENIPHVGSAS